jgi:hypothetical protein
MCRIYGSNEIVLCPPSKPDGRILDGAVRAAARPEVAKVGGIQLIAGSKQPHTSKPMCRD